MSRLNTHRIPYEVPLICGLPLQIPDRFQKSIDWLQDRLASKIWAWPLMLLCGTYLYCQRGRRGYIESDGSKLVAVGSNSFSRDDHAEMKRIAEGLWGDMRRSAGCPTCLTRHPRPAGS